MAICTDLTYNGVHVLDDAGRCIGCGGGMTYLDDDQEESTEDRLVRRYGKRSPEYRRYVDQRGSVAVADLACAFLVGFVTLICVTFGHHTSPTVLDVRYRPAAAVGTAATQAAPEPAVTVPAAVTAVPVPATPEKPATAVTDTPSASLPEIVAASVVHLSCEVQDVGQDAIIMGRPPMWYTVGVNSDVADANPARFRNCTADVAP